MLLPDGRLQALLRPALSYQLGHFYSFLWLIAWHILCAYFLWTHRVADEAREGARS